MRKKPGGTRYDVIVEWRPAAWGKEPRRETYDMTLTAAERQSFKDETFAHDPDVRSIQFVIKGTGSSVKFVRGLKMGDLK